MDQCRWLSPISIGPQWPSRGGLRLISFDYPTHTTTSEGSTVFSSVQITQHTPLQRGRGPNKVQNTIRVLILVEITKHKPTRSRGDHNTQYTDHLIHIPTHSEGPNIFCSYCKKSIYPRMHKVHVFCVSFLFKTKTKIVTKVLHRKLTGF